MSNFVSLEDAAKRLGVTHEELVDMLSRREIFGHRTGSSWQFKPSEIDRVAAEMMGDALDEDPAGSSILVSGSDLGLTSPSGVGSDVAPDGGKPDSDVELIADPEGGSDVRLVASNTPNDHAPSNQGSLFDPSDDEPLALAGSDDDDEELSLAPDDGGDLMPKAKVKSSSDLDLSEDIALTGSDALDLAPSTDESHIIGGESGLRLAAESDLIRGDSDPAIDALELASGSDLELASDDLVLGSGSDLALGSDSGINLMSPSDSGISLEDEPLDLAASGISGLDLAMEEGAAGSSVAGSGIDFQQDEEFQLSPSGSLETDDDSGSQVIELEDSSDFGDAEVALPAADGFDAFADVDPGMGGLEGASGFETAPAAAVPMGTPEVPYNTLQVLALLGILLLMCLSGLLVTDVVRNMWSWSESDTTLTSGFTEMVLSAFGMNK